MLNFNYSKTKKIKQLFWSCWFWRINRFSSEQFARNGIMSEGKSCAVLGELYKNENALSSKISWKGLYIYDIKNNISSLEYVWFSDNVLIALILLKFF